MDKEAFGRWLLSPLPLRKVFLAKNVTHGAILTVLYLVVAFSLVAIARVGLLHMAKVTVGFLCVLVLELAAGDLISVHWSKRIELTQMNSRMASNPAGFASLLVLLPLFALWGMIGFAAWYLQLPW